MISWCLDPYVSVSKTDEFKKKYAFRALQTILTWKHGNTGKPYGGMSGMEKQVRNEMIYEQLESNDTIVGKVKKSEPYAVTLSLALCDIYKVRNLMATGG